MKFGHNEIKMLKNQINNHHIQKDIFEFVGDGDCYGPATNKRRITRQTSFIDPSTGVDLLKSCSPYYLIL
jgi:hypothetical protein